MTTLRTAAQQALEALGKWSSGRDMGAVELNDLIAALEAALGQPEPQEIADLRQACREGWRYADELEQERKRLTAALAALEQPVQEPVAWLDEEINCAYTPAELDGGTTDGLVPLYTAPPQRKPAQEPVAWLHTDAYNPKVRFLEWTQQAKGYRGDWIKTPLYGACK